MKNSKKINDLPKLIFSSLFILSIVIFCLWIVQPFILSFVWAGMVVIASWPVMIYLEQVLWNNRFFAICIMTVLLLLLFFIPIILLSNSLIDNKTPIIFWLIHGHFIVPELEWLNNIPIIGRKIYFNYHNIIDGNNVNFLKHLQPYIMRTTGFFVSQAGFFGRFVLNFSLMLIFSILLYWYGEKVVYHIRHFAHRVGGKHGDVVVILVGQSIRSVALGIIVTTLVQAILGGIGLALCGIPSITILTFLIMVSCLMQLGPLVILVPSAIWLYWTGSATWALVLLVWSGLISVLDNVLRPTLIRMGTDLPMVLILSGIIGGLFAFGFIGIFIGPVVLMVAYKLLTIWVNEIPPPKGEIEIFIKYLLEDKTKENKEKKEK